MSANVVRRVVCRIELELECDEDVKFLYNLLDQAELNDGDMPDSLQELKNQLELIVNHYA